MVGRFSSFLVPSDSFTEEWIRSLTSTQWPQEVLALLELFLVWLLSVTNFFCDQACSNMCCAEKWKELYGTPTFWATATAIFLEYGTNSPISRNFCNDVITDREAYT